MYSELLFFFSAIGVFNTFLIAAYLLGKNKPSDAKFILGLFLIFVSVRTGIACIYFFRQVLPSLIQIGLCANLLSGTCLYIYVKTADKAVQFRDRLHLLLALAALIIFGFSVPFAAHFQLWDKTIRYIFHGFLTFYLIAAWFEMYSLPKKDRNENFQSKLLVLTAFSVLCLCFMISLYTTYILGPILYSTVLYTSCFIYYYQASRKSQKTHKKYHKKKIQKETAEKLLFEVNELMQTQELFKRKNLKIDDLAHLINVHPNKLSQILNENLGINFSRFVNTYRIAEVKKLLSSENMLTIEAIGLEAGFSSKTTFFKVFKQQTGQTPKSFLETSAETQNGSNLS